MNRRSIGWAAVGALALVSDPMSSVARAQPAPLVFTAIPDEDETRLVERFSIYTKYFESKLGVPVKYLPVKSYPAAVTAFTNNQVQFAWFGGLTGVQARLSVPDSDAIAQGAEDVAFKSYFIANASLGLTSAKDFPKGLEGRLDHASHHPSGFGRPPDPPHNPSGVRELG